MRAHGALELDRLALDLEVEPRVAGGERRRARCRDALHARRRSQAVYHLVVERDGAHRFVIAAGWQRQANDRELVGSEARGHVDQVPEADDQERRAREQDERERQFCHDERRPEPSGADAGRPPARLLVQRQGDPLVGRGQRRQDAEDHPRCRRRDDRRDEHASVHAHLIDAG